MKKSKNKETEEEKKQRKEREKQEKKEKKEKKKEEKKEKKESKKHKKSQHSESSSSLDSKGSRSHEQLNESTSVTKTTKITTSGSPGLETKTTVVQETKRDEHGERSTTTKTIEESPTKEGASGETVVKKTTTTITKSEPEPDKVVERSLTTKTETKIEETPAKQGTSGETVVKKTTTTITKSEPEPDKAVERSLTTKTETKIEETPAKQGASGQTVVKKTTTTITKSAEPEPDKDKSLITATETEKIEEAPMKVPSADDDMVNKTTTTITKSAPEPGKVVESKTIVKETSRSSPAEEEKVIITKTTSEVESGIPTTREFLEKNFPNMPEDARFEITQHFQNRAVSEDFVPSVDKQSHLSQRTVIQEFGDGGRTVKTVTKTVTDKDGTRKTTTTTSEGNGDHIISTDTNRKVDFPDWLEKKDTKAPKERATIDDTIKIPSPDTERKEQPKHVPTGPKVTEEIQPSDQKKENITDFLDDLAKASQEEPEEKPKPTQPNETENKITEVMDSLVESAPPKTENAIDFEEKAAPKPVQKKDEKVHKEKEVRKLIRDDGNTIETVTETKHEDGKVERTTTTINKQGKDQNRENIDINANILEPEKPKSVTLRKEKNKLDDDDIFVRDDEVINPEEIFEEIVVVEQKRKVRFPKSFLPRKPERPRSWVLPLDVLIDRPRTPKRTPHIYGLEVKEQVDEKAMDRSVSIQDLDDLLTAIDAAE